LLEKPQVPLCGVRPDLHIELAHPAQRTPVAQLSREAAVFHRHPPDTDGGADDEFGPRSPSIELHTTRRDTEHTMTKQLDHEALVDFTRRWFALWTEADPQARSRQVADLWATSGAQVLVDPPQEVRDAATALAFPVPRLEVRGHDEIDRRVTQAYATFVEPGVHTFKAAGDAVLLAPALVGLGWDMVTVADGTVAGSGYDVMALDDDGRILLDHQHIALS
jgi:hypothetical protein